MTPAGSTRVELPLPGLYNVYNAVGAAALAQALGATAGGDPAGLARFGAAFGRFERIASGDKTILVLLIKNPAGANEVVRTLDEGGAPPVLLLALNDAIADGKDVSWIWDVDLEPLLAAAERLIASGDRAAELALRCVYGGLDESALEVEPDLGARARPRAGADAGRRRARRPPHLHGDARAAADRRRARARRRPYWEAGREDPHRAPLSGLPEHLRRSRQHRGSRPPSRAARPRARGRVVSASGTTCGRVSTICSTSAAARIASRRSIAGDLAAKAVAIEAAVAAGAALLAVCGGYQLLGRGYRGLGGADLPGVGLFPHETVAGERRMIGDVLLECELEPGERRTLAGFENHAGRTRLDAGAEPLGRVVAGFGNDGESGYEGCRVGRAIGTYLHGPLLPRNPWLADWLLAQALAHADGNRAAGARAARRHARGRAHAVSAQRARDRGGRF